LACFIPKEEGEELTTRLEWADGALVKQTTPRQIKNIFDWTSAFIRFMGIYLQHHPGKSLEMLHYMDIIRLAYTKWGGFGWRAYDEQFRVLISRFQNTKCWLVIDQHLWSLCGRYQYHQKPSHPATKADLAP
jgi:hypothetical protein